MRSGRKGDRSGVKFVKMNVFGHESALIGSTYHDIPVAETDASGNVMSVLKVGELCICANGVVVDFLDWVSPFAVLETAEAERITQVKEPVVGEHSFESHFGPMCVEHPFSEVVLIVIFKGDKSFGAKLKGESGDSAHRLSKGAR